MDGGSSDKNLISCRNTTGKMVVHQFILNFKNFIISYIVNSRKIIKNYYKFYCDEL